MINSNLFFKNYFRQQEKFDYVRLCIYYIYIIIGLGITVFEFIRKIVRRAKQKKKEKTHNEIMKYGNI